MRKRVSLKRRGMLAAAVAVVAVVVAGYAYGAATDTSQVYTGCLQNGDLSKVAIGSTPVKACPANAAQISWNQTGPKGDQGIQGLKGDKGDKGDQGAPGPGTMLTGLVVVALGGSAQSSHPWLGGPDRLTFGCGVDRHAVVTVERDIADVDDDPGQRAWWDGVAQQFGFDPSGPLARLTLELGGSGDEFHRLRYVGPDSGVEYTWVLELDFSVTNRNDPGRNDCLFGYTITKTTNSNF